MRPPSPRLLGINQCLVVVTSRILRYFRNADVKIKGSPRVIINPRPQPWNSDDKLPEEKRRASMSLFLSKHAGSMLLHTSNISNTSSRGPAIIPYKHPMATDQRTVLARRVPTPGLGRSRHLCYIVVISEWCILYSVAAI